MSLVMWRPVSLLAVILWASSAFSKDDSPWIGKRVLTLPGVHLRMGSQIVENPNRRFLLYIVERTDGRWLKIFNENVGVRGWVKVEDVVPIDQAIDHFTARIRAKPKDASHYVNRGIVWHIRGELDIAIADFSEAIRLKPDLASAYFHLGVSWNQKKEFKKAIENYDKAIRLAPQDVYSLVNRAFAWCRLNEFDKAISDCNEAIRVDPKNASGYNGRAWIWATCPDELFRNGKNAVASATVACEIANWDDANHLGTLAAAYAELGDFKEAMNYQRRANSRYSEADARKKGEKLLNLYKENLPYRDIN